MKQVDEMPTIGQFVAVWELHDDQIESETLMWDSCGHLLVLMSDGFHEESDPAFYEDIGAQYFIAD